MLLRSSALIYPGLYLLTLGASCRYVVSGDPSNIILIDPGASAHVELLPQRFSGFGLDVNNIQHVILTHMDADRVAGIPRLRRLAPRMKLHGSAAMHTFLLQESNVRELWEQDKKISTLFAGSDTPDSLSFEDFRAGLTVDRHLADCETIYSSDDLSLRAVSTPGHRNHSMSYLVLPHEFLVVDESFGYFNGNKLAAPGADSSLNASLTSVGKFADIDVSGIGFPYLGAITGDLVRKHLDGVVQNTQDLIEETRSAFQTGLSEEEIKVQIQNGFYQSASKDPLMIQSMTNSFERIWDQLIAFKSAP